MRSPLQLCNYSIRYRNGDHFAGMASVLSCLGRLVFGLRGGGQRMWIDSAPTLMCSPARTGRRGMRRRATSRPRATKVGSSTPSRPSGQSPPRNRRAGCNMPGGWGAGGGKDEELERIGEATPAAASGLSPAEWS